MSRYHGLTTAELHAKGMQIALALGWQVQLKDGYPSVTLAAGDESGHALYLRDDKGRIEICPTWPKGTDGREMYPNSSAPTQASISVAVTREPREIAREITRRFLPGYTVAYAALVQRRDQFAAYEAQTAANVRRIKAAERVRDYGTQHSLSDHALLAEQSHIHNFRVQGDSVRFEFFSCPVDVALAILAAARKAEEGGDDE